MKKIKFSICYLLFIICASNTFAQTYVPFNYSPKFVGSEIVTGSFAVGQTISADASAVAELESTTKGFLLPRMTQAQREAIASPATGLMVYQTDGTEGFYYYTGAAWASIGLSTPVSVANGGTGISSYAIGDIIYASGATTLSKLPIGTANQQLRVNAGATALEYFTPASSGITVGSTTITSGTTLRVPYNNAGVYSELANFTMGSVATGVLDVPVAYGINGTRCFTHVAGNNATALRIGSDGTQSAAGSQTIMIGNQCGNSVTGAGNLGIGWFNSLDLINGVNNIAIGTGCRGASGSVSSTLIIGANTYASWTSGAVSNDAIIGENGSSGGYKQFYFGQGKTKPSPDPIQFNVTGGSGTNNAGASFISAGGKGTGTAAGGNNVEQTSVKLASGTTLQPLTDRHNIVGKYVDITAGSAQTFGNLALATSSTVSGGTVIYTIEANDATDYQSLSGVLKYDVVNKAGTLTVAFEDDQNSACACSAGTLTATVTAAVSGTNLLFQSDAASSLSETTLRVSFQVLNNFGQAVITPN